MKGWKPKTTRSCSFSGLKVLFILQLDTEYEAVAERRKET